MFRKINMQRVELQIGCNFISEITKKAKKLTNLGHYF